MLRPDFFIVILAAVVHATLQLSLGTLLLLYHASLGKHIKAKTRGLVKNYILGNGLLVMLMVSAAAFAISAIFEGTMNGAGLTILVGVLTALAFSVWTFYYRWEKSTEIWLPKSVAKYIDTRAKETESNIEAFALGMLACVGEILFTIALILTAGNSIVALPADVQFIAVACYTAIAVVPMIVMRYQIRSGKTVVDVQKWRVQNKVFLRTLSGVGYIVLALFILAFNILF